MSKTKSSLLALLAIVLAPAAANSDVITFDGIGTGSYGTFLWNSIYDTSEADVQINSALLSWGHGYNDLAGVAILPQGQHVLVLDIVALNGSTIFLDSFDLGNRYGMGHLTAWSVYDLATDDLLAYQNLVTVQYQLDSHPTFNVGVSSTTGIRLLINQDLYNNGLDNVVFHSVVVPETGILALLGIGLAGLGVTRRKKKN